jgi:signal transduction histidine kinase
MLLRDPLLTLAVMVFAHSCMTLLLRRLTGSHNLKRRLIDACLAADAITITALVAFFIAGSLSQFSMVAAMFLHFAPLGVLYQVAAFHFHSMPTLSSHRSTFLMPVAICAACSMLVAAGFFLSSPLGIVAEADVQLSHKTLMRSVIFALFSAIVASIAYWHILSRVSSLGHARRAELLHLRISRILVLACAWSALILSLGKLLPVHLSAREQVWTNLVGSSSFSSFSFVIGDAAAAWLDQAMVLIFANAPATILFIYLVLRLHMSAMIASPNFVPLDRARLIELRALLIDIIVRQQQFEFQRSVRLYRSFTLFQNSFLHFFRRFGVQGSVVTAVANSFGIDPASQPLAPELARALQKIESDLVDVFLQSATSSSSNTEVRNMIDQASIEDNGGAVELPTELDTADQLSMEKRAFLRNVTHCLRTPLHAGLFFDHIQVVPVCILIIDYSMVLCLCSYHLQFHPALLGGLAVDSVESACYSADLQDGQHAATGQLAACASFALHRRCAKLAAFA